MNECMEREIQEMLPDVLHGTLAPGDRARVDAHLAACSACRRELETLRAVHGAAVFTPNIDVDRIVRQIAPYRIITPVEKRPAASRTVGWLVATSLALVIAVGGSLLTGRTDFVKAPSRVVSAPQATASLALASGVEDLSDRGLEQLISELNEFDALPATDLEPIFDVDTTAALGQDSL